MKKWGSHERECNSKGLFSPKVDWKIQYLLFQHEGFMVVLLPRGGHLVMGNFKVSKWILVSK